MLFVELDEKNSKITYMAAVAFLMAVFWVTEALPLAITALFPLVLFPFFGIMNGKSVASQYFNHIIFLFIGGFLMAIAMEKWSLHKRIALKILLFFGNTLPKILLGFMAATAFLSMWISNTATAMMMVPIVFSVVLELESLTEPQKVKNIATALFLGVAYSASVGGIATLIGTPPNLTFARIFNITFPLAPEMTFAEWLVGAFPVSLAMFFLVWSFLTFTLLRSKEEFIVNKSIFRKELVKLGKFSYEEKAVFICFVTLAFLWIFRSDIKIGSFILPGWSTVFKMPAYINDGTTAVLVAVALFIIPAKNKPGRLLEKDAILKLPWHIILLFGGGFALAAGFKESGLILYFAGLFHGIENIHPLLLLMMLCTIITFLTELTSNTATAEILLPILASLSIAMKVNPLFIMIPAVLSCSFAFMLPVATPPNAVIFGTDRVSIAQMAKTGFFLNIIGVFIISLIMYFASGSLMNIDLETMPDWAVLK